MKNEVIKLQLRRETTDKLRQRDKEIYANNKRRGYHVLEGGEGGGEGGVEERSNDGGNVMEVCVGGAGEGERENRFKKMWRYLSEPKSLWPGKKKWKS